MSMTPEQYVAHRVHVYPTVYGGKGLTIDDATYRVMNQLLNIPENGIQSNEDLIENLSLKDDKIPLDLDMRYLTEDIYCGYFETADYDTIQMPTGEFLTAVDSDRVNYPDIVLWTISCQYDLDDKEINPYPNFTEQFSTVYKCPIFVTLGNDWLRAAITFYQRSRIFFLEPLDNTDTHRKNYSEQFINDAIIFIDKTIALLESHLTSP